VGEGGFAFIAALFLLVVLGAFVAFVVSISMNAQTSGALAVQGARAYEAARAGIEWATYQILDPRQAINGTITTPPLSTSILPGITRDTVIQIAQDLGHSVVEKQLIRTDLYLADEVFMTGTAAEVTPLREVDDQPIGPPGPVTLAIQKAYLDTVRGGSERWSHWLEYASTEPARAEA